MNHYKAKFVHRGKVLELNILGTVTHIPVHRILYTEVNENYVFDAQVGEHTLVGYHLTLWIEGSAKGIYHTLHYVEKESALEDSREITYAIIFFERWKHYHANE